MAQPLHRLRRADQFAGAATAGILLAGLLVDLARRRRAADRTGMREFIRHRVRRPLVDDDADDLRDDVARPLDHDGVADANVVALADRLAVRIEALDVILVVQRDVLDDDAADRDRRQPRHRRQRAGAADLDIDLVDRGRCLLGREFVGDGPARLAGDETPATLQFELVDLVDDAVDVVAERRALFLDQLVLGDQVVDRFRPHHQRAYPEPPFGEFPHRLILRRRRVLGGVAPGIGEEIEVAAGGDGGILLAQRAGRRVARIDIVLAAGGRRALLERLEFRIGHVDLAAYLDGFGPACALQPVRNVGDRPQIGGDVLAHRAVATCRALHEHTVLVTQRRRQPVDLRFRREGDVEVLVALEEPPAAIEEVDHVLVRIGLGEAEHRHGMAHLGEAFRRRRADPERRRILANQGREPVLDGEVAAAQRVIVGVRDRRRVLGVVAPVMFGDLAGQSFQLGGRLLQVKRFDVFFGERGHGNFRGCFGCGLWPDRGCGFKRGAHHHCHTRKSPSGLCREMLPCGRWEAGRRVGAS